MHEHTKHITRCGDSTRTVLYQEGEQQIRDWLVTNHTPSQLASLYHSYLHSRGEDTMESLLPPHSPNSLIAQSQDLIGFDNLLVGRLPKVLIETMDPILEALNRRSVNSNKLAKELSCQLLLFTHRQWTYWITTVHCTLQAVRREVNSRA